MHNPTTITIDLKKAVLILVTSFLLMGCSNNSGVKGIWEYEVVIPDMTVTGSININHQKDEYTGFISMFTDTFDLQLIKVTDSTLYLETSDSQISTTYNNDSLSGEVIIAGQSMPISAKRISKIFKSRELMMHVPVEPGDFSSDKNSIPTIIYDGDIGPDPCDYTTIAILLNYHKKGMINLIGMVGTTPDVYLVPVFDIFNSLYGTNIPIGSYKNDPEDEIFNNKVRKEYNIAVERDCKQVNKNKLIYEEFGKPTTKKAKDVLSSVDFYRKTLSGAENGSVIIYVAGQLFNFPALFESKPDEYSSLNGLELVQKKVEQFVFMGGYFPKSPFNEWNWWGLGYSNLTKNTIEALREIKMPILYVGFEQGIKLKIGTQLGEGAKGISASHPIVEAFRYFVHSPEKSVSDEGKILYDNPAFDELPVYLLAEGIFENLPCFSKVEGRAIINSEGGNEWQNEPKTNEFYLKVNSGCEDELRKLISDRVKGEFPAVMR